MTATSADSDNLDGKYLIFVNGTNEACHGFGYRFTIQRDWSPHWTVLPESCIVPARPEGRISTFVREVAREVEAKNG